MAKKPVKIELMIASISTSNEAVIRKAFEKAGFPMAPENNDGWTMKGHGLPNIHTGLAKEPDTTTDYRSGTVTFTIPDED